MIILWSVLILGGLAILFGLGLGFANKYLSVKEDERIDAVEALLPGYNCGACGTAGCRDFAKQVIGGEVSQLSKCRPGKADKNFDPIIKYLEDHPNEDGSGVNIKI